MRVRHWQDIINVQSITPNSILTNVWLGIGQIGLMRESYHLTLLVEHVVTIHILQGIDTIFTRGYTTNTEMASTIRTGNAEQGFGTESRVGQIGIKTYADALDRLEVGSINHITRHLEGINLLTRREGIGIITQRVVFVVICNSITEVNRISGVGYQRVLQLYHYLLSRCFDFRHLQLWRRNNDILRGVSQLDELIEIDGHLLRSHIGSLLCRCTIKHTRRIVVIPSTIRLSHSGAGNDCYGYQEYIEELLHLFSTINWSICSRVLLSRGTLCCPPNLPRCLSQSLKRPLRASMSSRGCNVMSLYRLAS